MFLFIFTSFMTYIDFIRPDWIELPRIVPPGSSPVDFTTSLPTHSTQSGSIQSIIEPVTSSSIIALSTEPSALALSEESYEVDDYYRSSKSMEDSSPPVYEQYPLGKKWRSKPSPFSGEGGHEPSSYYKWRNVSYSRVKSTPFVTDSVDYTILNPKVTPFEANNNYRRKDQYPKTVIIQSTTPMKSSAVHQKVNRIGIDTKVEVTTEALGEDEDELESVTEEEILDEYDSESDYPVEDEQDEEEIGDGETDDPHGFESTIAYQVQQPSKPPFSFQGFIDFMKNVQDSFLIKPAHSMAEKLKVLEHLRDRILFEVANRIKTLFGAPKKKQKRAIFAEKEHGVDFPSAEGALMTISFLTFAVFLIKLVLQVISSIKYKYVNNHGINQFAAIKSHKNARKFSFENEETLSKAASILSAIDR